MKAKAHGKIGLFDSGFGGLSILKEIVKAMPAYDYLYLGDTARAPYGPRSQKEIYDFTKQGVEFLFEKGAELVILACNSASSEALRKLQHTILRDGNAERRILGVLVPGAEAAAERTDNKKVGVLGTRATVSSHSFKRELQKIDPKIQVVEVAAPLLVPLVEAGEEGGENAKMLVKKYTNAATKRGIDTLILGCTHYGILEKEIKRNAEGITIISEGPVVAAKLNAYLKRHGEMEKMLGKNKKREFFSTGDAKMFDTHGTRFYGRRIKAKKAILP